MTAPRRFPAWIAPLALVVIVLAVFSPTVGYDFAPLDDDVNIAFNPHHGPLTWARIAASFGDPSYTRRYQPLGWILDAAIGSASGLAPVGYHAASVALHAVNALLLFLVLQALQRRFIRPTHETDPWSVLVAAVAAGWWALNPLRVETVAWISALPTNLSLTGVLLALRLHVGRPAPGDTLLPASLFAAGLLSYPVGLGAALFFPLLDWADGRRGRALLTRAAPYLAVALVIGLVNLSARAHVTPDQAPVPSLAELPAGYRLLRGFCFLTHYGWKPWLPFDLAPASGELLHLSFFSGFFLAGLGLAGVAGWLAFRSKAFALLLLAQVAVLLPITGWTELLHFPHDRYALWSDLAWAAGLALLLARWRSRAGVAVLGAAVAAGTALTVRQLPVWHSTESILTSIRARLAPGDAVPVRDIRPAFWLFREGRYEAAQDLLDQELDERPGDSALQSARRELEAMRSRHEKVVSAWGLTAEEVTPTALLHHDLARQCLARNEPEPAAWHLAEIARLSPRYYEFLSQPRAQPGPSLRP